MFTGSVLEQRGRDRTEREVGLKWEVGLKPANGSVGWNMGSTARGLVNLGKTMRKVASH